MELDNIIRLLSLIVLLSISAFFSSAETSISSLNVIKIKQLKNKGIKEAYILEELVENSSKTLSTILIGNNLVNIAATAIATELTINIFKGQQAIFISTTVMTLLVLIFGEITPKTYSNFNPEKVAVKVGNIVKFISVVFSPIIFFLNETTKIIIRLIGGNITNARTTISEDELKTIVDVGEEAGIIEKQEREMIDSIFEIGDIIATDVMVPRIDIAYVEKDMKIVDVVKKVVENGYSRVPVIESSIDNIIGIVYAKDLLDYYYNNGNVYEDTINSLIRPAYFVPESKKVIDLLTEMQLNKTHMAIVLDEYGGTLGLVTIEDILEEIVGEIFDEYDDDIELIDFSDENTLIVNSKMQIDEINEILNINLPEEDFDSIGGFIFNLLGRIPKQGDKIEYDNILFEILEVSNKRIKKLKISKK